MFPDRFNFAVNVEIQFQVANDLRKTFADPVERGFEIFPLHCRVITLIKQVRDLDVIRRALSGGGNNNIAAVLGLFDNSRNFADLCGICHGGSAEF